MQCSRQEARFILKRWSENRTPLLLEIKFVPSSDPLRMRGTVGDVAIDFFNFSGSGISVSLPFDDIEFARDVTTSAHSSDSGSSIRSSRLIAQVPGQACSSFQGPGSHAKAVLSFTEESQKRSLN